MVVGISTVKDEADIIERTIRHMAGQCDYLLVADNGSTDGTREFVRDFDDRVIFLDDPDPGHYHSRKMSELAEAARRDYGAEWIVPFDADELWAPVDHAPRVADLLGFLPEEAHICEAYLHDHVATPEEPLMPYRKAAVGHLRKVAVRAIDGVQLTEGNHAAHFPGVKWPLTVTGQLVIHHFPYRSVGQMLRKVRNGADALGRTTLSEAIGKHWRDYGRMTDQQLADDFYARHYSEDPQRDGLVYDPQ